MKLIIGLGNIGPRYTHTRHNLGFMVTDALAKDLEATWKADTKLQSEVATVSLEGESLILAKPQTMMNLSGQAVQRLMQKYKVQPDSVWVLFDDVDVPFGRLRLRLGGQSGGGHQGVNSIIHSIGPRFVRARLGISLNDRTKEPSEVYVLKPFDSKEQSLLPILINNAAAELKDRFTKSESEDSTIQLI